MPRGKGGAVQGKVGTPYKQRTDLNPSTPAALAPSQQYGERAAQQAAQRAIPVAAPPQGAPSAPTPTGGGAPPQPVAQGVPQRPPNAFPQTPPGGPGVLPFLHPTNRPNEPVTAGLPSGPGPGPEALTGVGAIAQNGAAEQGTLKNLLSNLASQPLASSALRSLAEVAGAGQ